MSIVTTLVAGKTNTSTVAMASRCWQSSTYRLLFSGIGDAPAGQVPSLRNQMSHQPQEAHKTVL
jgi:hypothetical protein